MITPFIDLNACSTHTIFPGVTIKTAAGEKMMLSLVDFEPGAIVEAHSHPHEQCGIVTKGRGRFIVDGKERLCSAGDMYMIPGGAVHKVIAMEEGLQALDVFSPIREDYL
ncbi:MAG: cupin domain-containing protein [Planctomycetota bacterium]|nr:cupin domain-containing protein [Planctomycetota bacterium]MDA1211172.1 cupin domain-containing protein [Planctomycetota bacterium]